MRTYIRYYIYRTFYVFIKCRYTSLGRHTIYQILCISFGRPWCDLPFAPRAPRSLMHMPKERLLGHSWSPRGFSTTGAKVVRDSLLEHLRLKKRLVISSLSFTMIDDPRLHSSSISSVVWNGCLTFSASWSLSKCCRKQSYWQNQSARHARARSSKTSRLSLEITVPCLEMVRRRSFLFGMACFLGSSKR